jgi:nitrite reductase/ring-hydroxylating ferredoxin subunit/uncharacterized membrane protein
MSEDPILALIEQQDWLQPVQEGGEKLVKSAFAAAGAAGQPIKNALHGVWLKHPLHAAITDVPVGSWTAAVVLDLLEASGCDEYGPGADAAVAIGLAGAVGSALTGLTDWSDTHGKAQRVGAFHGLLNIGAALLYGTSYALRKSGSRSAGRTLGYLGFATVLASAYLGGALSYSERVGVNHAPEPEEDLPQEFTAVCAESDLTEGEPKRVETNGTPLLLVKRSAEVFALAETCSHAGGPLAEGKVEGDTVVCPWHGSRFCLRSGDVIDGPATAPQPTLDVQVRDGQVFVRARRS